MLFSCPKCKGALSEKGGAFVCRSGHSFDIARAGYINLLPPSGTKSHGDNKEMVEARRDFLNTGHYLPLAERISELAKLHFEKNARVLDVGCGEGYYTAKTEAALFARDGRSSVSAFDISKDAVRQAAKSCARVDFAVASAYHIPASDEKFDAIINLFSPLAIEETKRVLKVGGKFLIAFPAEEHLFGLKAAIYDTPYKNTPEKMELEGFELLSCERLTYTMHLKTPDEIRALFMMTPYAYRTSEVGRQRIFAKDELFTDADFYLCVYEKT